MLSSEEISQRIVNSPAPLFFIDTCIFLDILRSVYREKIHVNAISSALELIKLSQNNSPKVWLVTNETVQREWNENITEVKKELENEIRNLALMNTKLITAAVIFEITHFHRQSTDFLKLVIPLEQLSKRLLKQCLVIKKEDIHLLKGMNRMTECIAPAQKGKNESKDCLIFEAFLDISEKIRTLNYSEKIYFLTSNSDDYRKPNKSLVGNDLEKIDAKLINNLPFALTLAEGRTR